MEVIVRKINWDSCCLKFQLVCIIYQLNIWYGTNWFPEWNRIFEPIERMCLASTVSSVAGLNRYLHCLREKTTPYYSLTRISIFVINKTFYGNKPAVFLEKEKLSVMNFSLLFYFYFNFFNILEWGKYFQWCTNWSPSSVVLN